MKTTAKILADSVHADAGVRLTTLEVCFPRFILAEFNTHRVMSRNFRSSRAVPVAKMIEEVRTAPFIPSQFTRNKPGMQGGDALDGEVLKLAEATWRRAAESAAYYAQLLADNGVHKQYANRGLEPYLYVHGVISATDWDNFFALRCHPDAQPEFQELACIIREARNASTPTVRGYRNEYPGAEHCAWHLPYITDVERLQHPLSWLLALSAVRCARVSYRPFDGQTEDREKVIATLSKLRSTPIHASPFEHQATPAWAWAGATPPAWVGASKPRGNFTGWYQNRQLEEDGSF